jgi:DNA-binding CsgD family transcriptional regulator
MDTITCGSWIGQLGKALAPRELEALLWVAQWLTTKEIARQMAVTPGTVANRIEAALFKLEAGRRIEAVTKAMRQQIISPLCIALAGLMATPCPGKSSRSFLESCRNTCRQSPCSR